MSGPLRRSGVTRAVGSARSLVVELMVVELIVVFRMVVERMVIVRNLIVRSRRAAMVLIRILTSGSDASWFDNATDFQS